MSHKILFTIMLALFAGCATVKEITAPVKDCADIRSINNQTLAACYVTVESLADQADALADAGVISKEQEMRFLISLADSLDFLNSARALVGSDADTARQKLELAQQILTTVAAQLEGAQ